MLAEVSRVPQAELPAGIRERPIAPTAPELREQVGVAGKLGDLIAQLAPALERVRHIAVERDRSDLVALAMHTQVHRAAVVIRAAGVERIDR